MGSWFSYLSLSLNTVHVIITTNQIFHFGDQTCIICLCWNNPLTHLFKDHPGESLKERLCGSQIAPKPYNVITSPLKRPEIERSSPWRHDWKSYQIQVRVLDQNESECQLTFFSLSPLLGYHCMTSSDELRRRIQQTPPVWLILIHLYLPVDQMNHLFNRTFSRFRVMHERDYLEVKSQDLRPSSLHVEPCMAGEKLTCLNFSEISALFNACKPRILKTASNSASSILPLLSMSNASKALRTLTRSFWDKPSISLWIGDFLTQGLMSLRN